MPFRSFGALEIGLIVLVILIVFGVGKLPQVGGAIGKGLRAFKKGQSGEEEEEEVVESPKPKKAARKKAARKKVVKS